VVERQGQVVGYIVNNVPLAASQRVELWNVLSVSWVLVHRKRANLLVKNVKAQKLYKEFARNVLQVCFQPINGVKIVPVGLFQTPRGQSVGCASLDNTQTQHRICAQFVLLGS